MPNAAPLSIVITLAEDLGASTPDSFAVSYRVDEHDCLEMAHALRTRGFDVYYANWDDIDPPARCLRRAYLSNQRRFVRDVPMARLSAAFLYKMEGFLRAQSRFFATVAAFEASCATVMNDPATIRHNIDKHYLFELAGHGIPIIPTHRLPARGGVELGASGGEAGAVATTAVGAAAVIEVDAEGAVDTSLAAMIEALHRQGTSLVLKPWRGERGQAIVKLDARDGLEHWRRASRDIDATHYLVQDFMPSVRAGERSLAFLGHSFQHAVIKFPNPDDPAEFRCNESLGGTVASYQPRADELALARQVLRTYEAMGYPVHFSRIDLIDSPHGPLLMEAELLNPSIYANYLGRGAVFGEAFAEHVWALLHSRR